MDKIQVLKECTIEGNIIKLPATQLDRKLYQEVAKSLELIGGKWKGGKIMGFVFQEDPTELLAQISGGSNNLPQKVNIKKEFQFFATPSKLADYLVEKADLNEYDSVLEPSAGQGAIINAIHRVFPNKAVGYYELMPTNQTILGRLNNVSFLGEDFLDSDNTTHFNKIIGNPPFSKNQDISHIYKMYERLAVGGRLVSITSKHWVSSSNKKEVAFREWLDRLSGEIEEIQEGSFKESGTSVGGMIITIIK